jgi:hypothetical protein
MSTILKDSLHDCPDYITINHSCVGVDVPVT